jgi:hypothetical protein
MFLRNICWLSTDYTALYPRRQNLRNHRCENLKSYIRTLLTCLNWIFEKPSHIELVNENLCVPMLARMSGFRITLLWDLRSIYTGNSRSPQNCALLTAWRKHDISNNQWLLELVIQKLAVLQKGVIYCFTTFWGLWIKPLLRSRYLHIYARISQHFIEPGGSLTCSQEPSTGPCPEPDQSSPFNPILFFMINCNIIIPPTSMSS